MVFLNFDVTEFILDLKTLEIADSSNVDVYKQTDEMLNLNVIKRSENGMIYGIIYPKEDRYPDKFLVFCCYCCCSVLPPWKSLALPKTPSKLTEFIFTAIFYIS